MTGCLGDGLTGHGVNGGKKTSITAGSSCMLAVNTVYGRCLFSRGSSTVSGGNLAVKLSQCLCTGGLS